MHTTFQRRTCIAAYICYLGLLLLLSYLLTSTWAGFFVVLGSGILLGTGVLMLLPGFLRPRTRESDDDAGLGQRFHLWRQNNDQELQALTEEDLGSGRFTNPYFVVFQADINTPRLDDASMDYTGILTAVKRQIAQLLPIQNAGISVSAVQNSIIGCINYAEAVAGDPDAAAQLIGIFQPVQQSLLQSEQVDLTFSVSDVDLKQDELSHAFQQLEDLHWYMDIFSYDPSGETVTLDLIQAYVLTSDERANQFQSRNLLQLEKHFITCVLDENYVSAQRLINTIINQSLVESYAKPIECYPTTFEKVKGLVYDAIEAARLQMDPEFFVQLFPKYGITDVSTVAELQQRCDYIFSQLIQYDSQQKANVPPKLYSQIEAYVDSHITDPALNISAIALALHQNPTTISRVFKEHSDMALLDFIHRRRVDIAKHKLEEGMTVSCVAEETGFGSARSFTRAFQKLEGVSPSSYQEIHRVQ